MFLRDTCEACWPSRPHWLTTRALEQGVSRLLHSSKDPYPESGDSRLEHVGLVTLRRAARLRGGVSYDQQSSGAEAICGHPLVAKDRPDRDRGQFEDK